MHCLCSNHGENRLLWPEHTYSSHDVWVDAHSVNQSDAEERMYQVRVMSVYSERQKVCLFG